MESKFAVAPAQLSVRSQVAACLVVFFVLAAILSTWFVPFWVAQAVEWSSDVIAVFCFYFIWSHPKLRDQMPWAPVWFWAMMGLILFSAFLSDSGSLLATFLKSHFR